MKKINYFLLFFAVVALMACGGTNSKTDNHVHDENCNHHHEGADHHHGHHQEVFTVDTITQHEQHGKELSSETDEHAHDHHHNHKH